MIFFLALDPYREEGFGFLAVNGTTLCYNSHNIPDWRAQHIFLHHDIGRNVDSYTVLLQS